MAKRRKMDVDNLALRLESEKGEFDENFQILRTQLEEFMQISKNIKCIYRRVKKTNKSYDILHHKAVHVLSRLFKAENDLANERQLRIQSEEQVKIYDEEIEQVEGRLAEAQVENDELRVVAKESQKRIDFVEEAKIHEMMEICEKFETVRATIQNESFVSKLLSLKSDLIFLKRVFTPNDDEEEGLCIVCKTHIGNHIFIPCGHQCICEFCAKNVEESCPYCRTPFTIITKVYKVD